MEGGRDVNLDFGIRWQRNLTTSICKDEIDVEFVKNTRDYKFSGLEFYIMLL